MKNIILRGDKDSRVVIMNRSDYIVNLEGMIEEGVKKSTYIKTEATTLQDLKKFQDFLYRNFNIYKHYKSRYPHSNQSVKLCGTAKTHKFNNIQEINTENLKLPHYYRPIRNTQLQCSANNLAVLKTTLKKQIYNK